MKIAIRTDATQKIGFGHLVRCLTLAQAMRAAGHEVAFISRGEAGFAQIEGFQFKLFRLEEPLSNANSDYSNDAEQSLRTVHQNNFLPNLWIVDHYFLDLNWEKKVRSGGVRLLVVEDVPNRSHDCDYLLVQNEISGHESPYAGLVNSKCIQLLGPNYALLKPEFAALHLKAFLRSGTQIQKILVFYGTTDVTNEVAKTLQMIDLLQNNSLQYIFVVQNQHPLKEELLRRASLSSQYEIHIDTTQMAELMLKAQLALGSGGFATFERFCLGTATLAVSVADNQTEILKRFHTAGFLEYLGESKNITAQDLKVAVEKFLRDPKLAEALVQKSYPLTDGNGCQRVMNALSLS
jgi:UDP-2,4-diacetamido-2,4,6-trideoxy-beta-L-altropyranose hydrolase